MKAWSWLISFFSLLSAGCAAFFFVKKTGKAEGVAEAKKQIDEQILEQDLANKAKKEEIHEQVSNSDLDSLVASNNDKYGTSAK